MMTHTDRLLLRRGVKNKSNSKKVLHFCLLGHVLQVAPK